MTELGILMVIMIEELSSRTYLVCTSRSQFSEEDSFHAAFFFKPLLVASLVVVHVASQLDQMMDQQQRPGFPAQTVGCNRKFPASWQEWGPRIFLGA